MTAWPSVGVVVPTRDRPAQLARALAAIAAQDYPGQVQVVVVFDGAAADKSLARHGQVRVLARSVCLHGSDTPPECLITYVLINMMLHDECDVAK